MKKKTVGKGQDRLTAGKLDHPAQLDCGLCQHPVFVKLVESEEEVFLTPGQAKQLGQALMQMAEELSA